MRVTYTDRRELLQTLAVLGSCWKWDDARGYYAWLGAAIDIAADQWYQTHHNGASQRQEV